MFVISLSESPGSTLFLGHELPLDQHISPTLSVLCALCGESFWLSAEGRPVLSALRSYNPSPFKKFRFRFALSNGWP